MLLVATFSFPDARRNITNVLTLAILVLTGAVCWWLLSSGIVTYAFGGMYVTDPMANLLKLVAIIAVALVLVYAQSYARDRGLWKGELFTLSLFSLLGIMLMISANNLLVIYLGLELQALSLYTLVALRRDDARVERGRDEVFRAGRAGLRVPAVAGHAGGQHAVEHVHAAGDQLHHLRRRAQAHGVARLVRRAGTAR